MGIQSYHIPHQHTPRKLIYRIVVELFPRNEGPVWDAIMQGDGNLVIYDPRAHPLWASATAGNAGAWLVGQNDGNLVIYDANGNPL